MPRLRAVRQHALAEQRRPAVDDRVEELVVAVDVGERLVHAGERRAGGVLGRRRRAHRDARVVAEPLVGRRATSCAAPRACPPCARARAAPCAPRRRARRRRRRRRRHVQRDELVAHAALRPSPRGTPSAVTTNPGGTGSPARVSSPRLAPLPPARARPPSTARRTTRCGPRSQHHTRAPQVGRAEGPDRPSPGGGSGFAYSLPHIVANDLIRRDVTVTALY